MTAQAAEVLIYQGQEQMLFSNPLEDYFDEQHPRPNFVSPHTANWRGYVGTWELEGERLYLVGLQGEVAMGESRAETQPYGLADLFPGSDGRVEASWFSGTLRVPVGPQLHYVHMGYGSVYERELLITLEQGQVVRTEEVEHRDEPPPGFRPC